MKLTLRQLESRCREINRSLRGSASWGVSVERYHDEVFVLRVPRDPAHARESVYSGTVREAGAFLDGMVAGAFLVPACDVVLDGSHI